MKFEITERDKKLLVMLSIFVIVVCIGYWGIYPVMKEKKKLGKEILCVIKLLSLKRYKPPQRNRE